VTEAPMIDWLLMLTFSIFGKTYTTFRVTFVLLNIFSILIFFLFCLRYFNLRVATLAGLFFASMPISAYYAGHSLGEDYLFIGRILLFITSYWLVVNGWSLRRAVLFALVLVYIIISKVTTGGLLAIGSYFVIGGLLAFQNRQKLIAMCRRARLKASLIALVLIGGPLVLYAIFMYNMERSVLFWERPATYIEFYQYIFTNWYALLGPAVMIFWGVGLVFFLVFIVGRFFSKKFRLDAQTLLVLAFFLVNVFQFYIQSRPFLAHEYYSMTWITPSILVGLCPLYWLTRNSRPLFANLGFLAYLVVGLCFLANNAEVLNRMNKYEAIPAEDRKSVAAFFEYRKTEQDNYYIIAQSPYWAYCAQTNMVLQWAWQDLNVLLHKDNLESLKNIGLKYVIFPRTLIPADVVEKLKTNPLVDLGPERLKLGLVQRGTSYYLFKLTTGIKKKESFENVKKLQEHWITSEGHDYTSSTLKIAGSGRAVSPVFIPQADTLTFMSMTDYNDRANITLDRLGKTIYQQPLPYSTTAEFCALDTGIYSASRYMLVFRNERPDKPVSISNIQLVKYNEIF
jgi:4-amino-4-deoxy-L-arabinose transferase-like glycosyltransferase